MTAEPRSELDGRECTASVNGTGVRVEEVGSGEQTVVFSPNPFTNRASFDAPVAALSGDYRCLSYDHRGQGDSGFGASQPSPDRLGTEGLYEDAVALLEQLGVDSCHWVGSSIGGMVGVRVAARHPELVRSLVLLGFSTRRQDMGQVNFVAGGFGGLVTGSLMRGMFGKTFMSDPARAEERELWRQWFATLLVPKAAPMHRAVLGHPGTPPELLAQVEAPTLIIVGEDERPPLLDDCAQAQRDIPDARLVTIPGAGHVILIEQPDAGTAAITEFIRGVDAA